MILWVMRPYSLVDRHQYF